MKRIAIIGGGISGLSAAFALEEHRRAGAPLEYVLFESSPRLGGVLRTEQLDGCVVEAGPDSFLTEKPWAADLCRKLGLGDQLIGSNDAERKTYILVKGRLVAMPDGLMFMVPTKILPVVFSPLFSLGTKFRMVREWFSTPQSWPDQSVAALVERHYGTEVVERLTDPLLAGVYGGDASHLGVRAVLPRFAEMETKYGSLSKAMLAARKKMATAASGAAKPLFTSLKNGMQSMADAVLARLPPDSIRSGAKVEATRPQADGWQVVANGKAESFDAAILALSAQACSALLVDAPDLASELGGIAYSSSITVTLGYEQIVRAALPPGFGFLVPRTEGKQLLAATFVHNKFPFRAPEDRALIRCFLGGASGEQALQLSDEEILCTVRGELRQILGLAAEPRFTRVYKWPSAMAQYGVGHPERLERIERLRCQLPGLFLAGNGYRGIGVPDCVRSGKEAAGQALAATGVAEPRPQVTAS
jgi:protoporphyrinogen/coproporphyrinogen III oxidase